MKCTIERAELLKTLGHIHRVVEKKNTIPILSNVLLSAKQDGLAMRATDLDIEVSDCAKAVVATPAATTVNASLFFEIVRKLPEGSQVVIESGKDTTIVVKAGRSRFVLQTLPESDFPDLAASEPSHRFTLDGSDIAALFGKTQFAISTEETRYYLNGVHLHVEEERIIGVATDGHRLAKVVMPIPNGAHGMPPIIVPRKTVGEVMKLAIGVKEIAVALSTQKITFTFGDTVLTSKLIDGTFPDYKRVIPSGSNKVAILDRSALMACVGRVAIVSSERGRATKLSFSAGRLEASVTNADTGTANEDMEADYDAEPLDIGFNSRYLTDIGAGIDADKVRLEMTDPGSPTIIRGEGDASTLFVLMPMRV